MKKLLFFRNTQSDFVILPSSVQFSVDYLIKEGYEVTVYDPKKRRIMNYNTAKCKTLINIPKLLNFPAIYIPINFFALLIFALKNYKKYDISTFMYSRIEYFVLSKFLYKISKNNYVFIFGNIFKRKTNLIKTIPHFYKKADKIIVPSMQHRDDFVEYMKNNINEDFDHKTLFVELPKINFNILSKIDTQTVDFFCEKYKIPNNDNVIIIGSNAGPYEQHSKIIDELALIKENLRHNTTIIFPLTYSPHYNAHKYISTIINHAETKLQNCNMIFIDRFLPPDEMLSLRKRSDIFLNMRSSDQFAASVKESLLIGSIIISGSWLPYNSFIDKNKIFVYKINSIDKLHVALIDVLSNFTMYKSKSNNNSIIMKDLFNNDLLAKKWSELFR